MGTLLENSLTYQRRKMLVRSLNVSDKWNYIIEGLKPRGIFLDQIRMREVMVNKGISAADWVLNELIDREWLFSDFCQMLRMFDLLEELSILVPAEPLVIELQPGAGEERVVVDDGGEVELTCEATGVPRPTYQWYHNNTALQGQTSSNVTLNNFSEEDSGIYQCEVSQLLHGQLVTQWSADVEVVLAPKPPELVMDLPALCPVPRGQSLLLVVEARGYPLPRYQWLHNCDPDIQLPSVILQTTSNTLEVKNIGPEDEGFYQCRVYNDAGETFSNKCNLTMFEHPPEYIASAKVALLIGNEQYDDTSLTGLHAPSNDVVTLSEILTQLGFHVIALHNLTRTEMYNAFRWFSSVLPEGAYAFFYFAGHGLLKMGAKCMMPVDCPKNNTRFEHCLCDEQLMKVLASAKPQLLVNLFDCCLIESSEMSVGRTDHEHHLGNCNVVVGTSTGNHQYAYERDRDTNSLFIMNLRSHLAEDLPVFEVLRANLKDFRGQVQKPTIFCSGADNCSLRDPVSDNPEIEERIRLEVDFPSYEQDLYFSKINEHFTVHISKHRNCFLNSVDLEFPKDMIYNFSVEINPPIVDMVLNEKKVLTIYNIQRFKSTICVTVTINGLRRVDGSFVSGPDDNFTFVTDPNLSYEFIKGPYDSCEFSLDCPIIYKQLWSHRET